MSTCHPATLYQEINYSLPSRLERYAVSESSLELDSPMVSAGRQKKSMVVKAARGRRRGCRMFSAGKRSESFLCCHFCMADSVVLLIPKLRVLHPVIRPRTRACREPSALIWFQKVFQASVRLPVICGNSRDRENPTSSH